MLKLELDDTCGKCGFQKIKAWTDQEIKIVCPICSFDGYEISQ